MIEALNTLYSHGVICTVLQATGNASFPDLFVIKNPQLLRCFQVLVGMEEELNKNDDSGSDPSSGDNDGNNNGSPGGGDDPNPASPSNGNNEGGDCEDSNGDNNHDDGHNPHGGATTDAKTAALVTDEKKSPQ